MSALAIAPDRDDLPHEDHHVVLSGVTWADYQRLLEVRGDRSAPRITYLEGRLEIMSPSRMHESIKSLIGRLVEVYCIERNVEFNTFGSWTLEDKTVERGVEPDECYVFSAAAEPVRPDLAIEVVWTSGGINKLDVYKKLGVREVWYWRKGRITPYVLRDAEYVEVPASEALQGIDLAELASFLDRPTTSAAIRAYRDALRAKPDSPIG
jgi:Uma2 family endonuclease